MPKVPPEHLEARRGEILSAAWRCFGRKGFHRTTMRDVCREADVSAGALYQYFPGKSELIQAVAEEARRTHATRIVPVDAADDPPSALAESLRRFLDCLDDPAILESIRVDVRLAAEGLHEPEVRAAVLENHGGLLELLVPLVRRGQETGALAQGLSPDAVSRVVLAIFLGLELQKALDPDVDVGACAEAATAALRGTFAHSPTPVSNG